MVLRKKNSQISFLHVYHHTGMVLGGWVGTRFVPGKYLSKIPILFLSSTKYTPEKVHPVDKTTGIWVCKVCVGEDIAWVCQGNSFFQ